MTDNPKMPSVETKKQAMQKLSDSGLSYTEIAKIYKVSRQAVAGTLDYKNRTQLNQEIKELKQRRDTLKSQADKLAGALKALSDVSYETFQAWPDLEEQARAALAAYQEGE